MLKERNSRAFEEIENDYHSIKNRWFYLLGSLFLGHDIQDLEDLEMVLDHLIEL